MTAILLTHLSRFHFLSLCGAYAKHIYIWLIFICATHYRDFWLKITSSDNFLSPHCQNQLKLPIIDHLLWSHPSNFHFLSLCGAYAKHIYISLIFMCSTHCTDFWWEITCKDNFLSPHCQNQLKLLIIDHLREPHSTLECYTNSCYMPLCSMVELIIQLPSLSS